MAICDICNKVMPGANASITIKLGQALAPGWQNATHESIAQSPKLVKHGVMVHAEYFGLRSDQINDEHMDIWLKHMEEQYGRSDWLLCPECGSLLDPSKKIKKSYSESTQGEPEIEQKEGGSLTQGSQTALWLTEPVLQLFSDRGGHFIYKKGTKEYSIIIDPETAKWAMPYCRRIASAHEHLSKHDFKKASIEFQNILEELPDAAIILNALGNCYAEMGNTELARKFLQKALINAPMEKRDNIVQNLRRLEQYYKIDAEKQAGTIQERKNIESESKVSKETTLKRKWWQF